VLNPSELYRYESDGSPLAEPAAGRGVVLIVAMGGFIDAGHAQRLLTEHLLAGGEAAVVASFDVDQLMDYRGRRPAMVFDTNRWSSYEDPSLLLYRLADRDGTPYYLLAGDEPDYQWERVVEAIRQLIDDLGITLTVSAHGIPMAVPHTRPLGMSRHATHARLLGEDTPLFGRVQVPGSLSALLELRLGEAGQDAIGFAIHVPHYLAQAEFPDAAVAALNAIVDHTGLNLPNDALVAAAGATRAEIAREVAGSEEVAQVVSALEHQYDAFIEGQQRPSLLATGVSEVPTAEEIGAEFEEFLRNVSDDKSD
jgi:nucleotide-binding universal stress UspA family protein